jgi:hypothetical protein
MTKSTTRWEGQRDISNGERSWNGDSEGDDAVILGPNNKAGGWLVVGIPLRVA